MDVDIVSSGQIQTVVNDLKIESEILSDSAHHFPQFDSYLRPIQHVYVGYIIHKSSSNILPSVCIIIDSIESWNEYFLKVKLSRSSHCLRLYLFVAH